MSEKYRIVEKSNGRFKIQCLKISFFFWVEWRDIYKAMRGQATPIPGTGGRLNGEYDSAKSAEKEIDSLLHPEDDGPKVVGVYTKKTVRKGVGPKLQEPQAGDPYVDRYY